MNLVLNRREYRNDGIFSEITDENGTFLFVGLERSYKDDSGVFYAKVPPGTYRCVRGIHRLKDLVPFETFELENVPGRTGILIHKGNYNHDSEGCILIGLGYGFTSNKEKMIVHSKKAFEKFMELQKYNDEFYIVIA